MKSRHAVLVLVLAAGCSAVPAENSAPADPMAGLRRPWAVQPLAEGAPCPVTTKSSAPDPETGPVLGGEQVGPLDLEADAGLNYSAPPDGSNWKDHAWGLQKVAWGVDPALTTPVLVRGRQLDGTGGVKFNDPAVDELVLDPTLDALPGGWRQYPGYTRLRTPGCYAYQVDHASGSFAIVFRAVGPVMS